MKMVEKAQEQAFHSSERKSRLYHHHVNNPINLKLS
jgi:hypothetical protein